MSHFQSLPSPPAIPQPHHPFPMPSNIEQAISLVLDSHQSPQVSTVLNAYLRIAGFPLATPDAVTLFERALDKHPHMEERPAGTVVTKAITDVRQDYYMRVLDLGSLVMPGIVDGLYKCPCCGRNMSEDEMKRKVLALEDGLEMEQYHYLAAPEKPKKIKSKRRIATKTKARMRKARPFDPYGPSTSASSM